MLIGNYSVQNKSAGRWMSGPTISTNRSNWNTSGSVKNMWMQQGLGTTASMSPYLGYPAGYNMEYSQIDPLRSGGMVSQRFIFGAGSLDSSLLGGYGIESNLVGNGDVTNAACGLLISAVAALTGSGVVSASMQATLQAVAALAGSGDLAGAMGALAGLVAALTGSSATSPNLTAKGSMGSSITVTGDLLSTANVGEAVWNFMAENGYTANDLIRLLTAIAVGKTTITGSTVTFRDLADSKNRVVAVMDGSERDSITLDPS